MSDTPGYMQDQKAKKQEAVEKAAIDIEKDREKMNDMQRFGFFSIPYPAICNDKAYSRENNYKHQIVDRKVITEPRGIYTQNPKKGRLKDAYFSVDKPWTDQEIENEKQFRKDEKEKLFALVDQRRKNESKGPTFKPGGPQEVTGYYKVPGDVPNGPIYKQENRFKHIGPDRKVLIEQRGIYCNPPKEGPCLYPNDYFSFYFTPQDVIDRVKKGRQEEEDKKLERVKLMREKKLEYIKPFIPASLKKCDAFTNNYDTYGGITDDERKNKVEEYKENKKKGNPKYVKVLPEKCVKHNMPFKPARLLYSGRDGLFNDNLYQMPNIPPAPTMTLKERLEYEEKHKKEPFRSCKLMKTSHFAPCISSFTSNLKKDFPTVHFN